jgi:4-aminobutyrate aminotransferase
MADWTNGSLVSAEGCFVTDNLERQFLDATSQGGLTGLGHNHPVLRAAQARQLAQLPYVHGRYEFATTVEVESRTFSISRQALHDALLATARRAIEATQIFLNVSGSAALMTAIKACRISRTITAAPAKERDELLHARRSFPQFAILAFEQAYHGHLGEAQLLTDCRASYRVGSGPSIHVERLPFPRRGMTRLARAAYLNKARHVLDRLEQRFDWRIACFVFEPISGFGHLPDEETLRTLCAQVGQRGILLVADEFKTGQGRIGRDFACQWAGLRPDVIVFSKILTGGYPGGAVAATEALRVGPLPPETYWDAATFAATPLTCVSMIVTLDIIEREHLVRNAELQGRRLLQGLGEAFRGSPLIRDIDGTGLLVSITLADEQSRDRLHDNAMRQGVLVSRHGRGWGRPTILLMPPLVINDAETDMLIARIANAEAEVRGMPATNQ